MKPRDSLPEIACSRRGSISSFKALGGLKSPGCFGSARNFRLCVDSRDDARFARRKKRANKTERAREIEGLEGGREERSKEGMGGGVGGREHSKRPPARDFFTLVELEA
jgi:hypothetical protein